MLKRRSDQEADVLVIGAGPAGSLAAHELARRGLRVLLVDRAKFPRFKVCGSILHPEGIAVLRDCNLASLLTGALAAGDAVPLREARISLGRSRATIDLRGSLAWGREALDAALVNAAVAQGVEFRDATLASLPDNVPVDDRRSVRLCSEDEEVLVRASLVIAADGLNGLLSRSDSTPVPARQQYLGAACVMAEAPVEYRVGCLAMACGRAGYVGAVRLGDGRLLLACALDPEETRRVGGVAAVAAAILDEARLPAVAGLPAAHWYGTSKFPAGSRVLAAKRLFAVGDSASFVEPFTGQGMSWALLSARAVVPLATDAVMHWRDSLIAAWTGVHASVVGRRQRACHGVAWLLRHPWLARPVVAALGRLPWLSLRLVRKITQ